TLSTLHYGTTRIVEILYSVLQWFVSPRVIRTQTSLSARAGFEFSACYLRLVPRPGKKPQPLSATDRRSRLPRGGLATQSSAHKERIGRLIGSCQMTSTTTHQTPQLAHTMMCDFRGCEEILILNLPLSSLLCLVVNGTKQYSVRS